MTLKQYINKNYETLAESFQKQNEYEEFTGFCFVKWQEGE